MWGFVLFSSTRQAIFRNFVSDFLIKLFFEKSLLERSGRLVRSQVQILPRALMANNNIEIEIKIPLDNETFLKVKEKLNQIAKFQKTTKQSDAYFTPAHKNFVEPKFPFEWLSIRKRSNKIILNYKHYYPENVQETTHCDEFEAEIKEQEQIEKIFSALNFKNLVTVEKEREVFVFNEEFEIALDKVKGLGYFVEIESIRDFGSVEETRKKLIEFAKIVGVDVSKIDKRGYPFLLMQKHGLIK